MENWRDFANCRFEDPELFFGVSGGVTELNAVAVCNRCDVRQECLAYALEGPELFGTWGGKTENQRKNILRRRANDERDADRAAERLEAA